MRDITIAITAASYSGNKGAAAMLQSSIKQLHNIYGDRLNINLMSVYPKEDKNNYLLTLFILQVQSRSSCYLQLFLWLYYTSFLNGVRRLKSFF